MKSLLAMCAACGPHASHQACLTESDGRRGLSHVHTSTPLFSRFRTAGTRSSIETVLYSAARVTEALRPGPNTLQMASSQSNARQFRIFLTLRNNAIRLLLLSAFFLQFVSETGNNQPQEKQNSPRRSAKNKGMPPSTV
eukprot:scpid88754/ scgid17899/ 